ncbi:interferon-induced protein with tetratricopeptide repeats 8 [Chanos chanos]|uniref:Interferon-induced protein with tetratricopeptide repeats 8 n=1 Tax=Chanos chanos TaxID=29144 RepID=A0A6J2V8N0_CHACN|nr:interferon-induced protein with tetratricopeptide repeats 1-like [Chanos chanos]
MSSKDSDAAFVSDLGWLECHFTWDFRKEDTDLNLLAIKFSENLSVLDKCKKNLRRQAFNFLAYIKYLQGSSEKALEYLESAEEENMANKKECIVTYGNMAWVHYNMGKDDVAKAYTEKVQDIYQAFPIDPTRASHREVQSEKAWSLLQFSKKYYGRAKECFHDALQREPEDKEWNTGYAFSLFRLEGLEIREDKRVPCEKSPAVIQLKKALTLDPDNAMIHVYLGLKCHRNQRNAEAWEHMRTALQMAPEDLSVALRVAKFMKKEEYYDMALDLLKRMLKKAPNSSRLHHEIANDYRWKAKQLKDEHNPRLLRLCIQHLEEGARLNPGFIYPQLEMAVRYAELNNTAKAELKFQELRARPNLRDRDLQAWHRMYGDFHLYRLSSEGIAVKHYKEGMRLQRVSTEWRSCRNRLFKILRYRRDDVYQIREFINSFKRGESGDRAVEEADTIE